MRRGTTPTHKFKPRTKSGDPIDLTSAEVIYITYKQDGMVRIEKEKSDMTVTEDEIVLELTQEDTLALSTIGDVEIECRARFPDQKAVASTILEVPVHRILKEGII